MIRLPSFTYLAPRTLAEAAGAMVEHGRDAMLVAGGTDLYPNMKRRQFEPKVVVGLLYSSIEGCLCKPFLKTCSSISASPMPM